MITLELLQNLWFVLIMVLLAGYTILDGFDLGIGILLPFLGKNKEDKDKLVNSVSPFWDGNEVWLLTGGGALFAAFPQAYATSFSGFYLAFMLVLFALIFRAVSFEFRAHSKQPAFWEWALVIGSFLVALLIGVALGNVVYGVPLDSHMEFTGNFFTLLRPVPLLFGLLSLCAILVQGASYAVLKNEGEIQKRAYQALSLLLIIEVVLFLVLSIVMVVFLKNQISYGVMIAGSVIALFGFISLFAAILKKSEKSVFWLASVTLAGLWLIAGSILFPNLIRAINDPALNITIRNASTSILTLKIMSVIAICGMPVVIGYTIFVYSMFKGKMKNIGY